VQRSVIFFNLTYNLRNALFWVIMQRVVEIPSGQPIGHIFTGRESFDR
jgi:hypothetical protein